MRFFRQGGIYRSDVVPNQTKVKTKSRAAGTGRLRWSDPDPGKERVGRTTPFSSSSMSSAPAIP